MTPISNKSRLQWLDALRGFTMILVVTFHVAQLGFGESMSRSAVHPWLLLFRMPLFFFVSGFLSYKASTLWTARTFGTMTLKKMKVQLIPTIVFFVASCALLDTNFLEAMHTKLYLPTKGGYWFTYVLLLMFIIYYAFAWLESKLPKRSWIPITILWTLFLGTYAILQIPPAMKWIGKPTVDWLNHTSVIQVMIYMQFFIFGNIVRRYWDKWQSLFDVSWFFPLVILIIFVCSGEYLRWHNITGGWEYVPRTLASYSLLLLVVMFFRHYKGWFTTEKHTGRVLQYVGKRTLDIYLLHYFFLPKIPEVGVWFNGHTRMFAIDFAISFLVACLIIAFCCLTSHTLRISPFLSEYLFGRKVK